MARPTNKLELREGDYKYLRSLIKQRTIQAQVVIRAHILLDKSNGIGIREIANIYDLSPTSVQHCINKYIEGGTDSALFDEQRKGRPAEITDEVLYLPDLPVVSQIQTPDNRLFLSPNKRSLKSCQHFQPH